MNEKKSYRVEDFRKIGGNKFLIWLYHKKDDIEIHEKYEIELLSKTDGYLLLLINHIPYELYLDEIDKNKYEVRSHKWPQPNLVRILGKLTPTIQRREPDKRVQPTEPSRLGLPTKIYRKSEPGIVRAHMPGIIVKVKVKKGDEVTLGQPLCILEAMKMENEITANKAGIVEEVTVQKGASVGQGKLLVKIK